MNKSARVFATAFIFRNCRQPGRLFPKVPTPHTPVSERAVLCRLDYNQESQFEHVFASGHPELASSYFGSILEYSDYTGGPTNGVGAHLAETMASSGKLNGTCPEGYGALPLRRSSTQSDKQCAPTLADLADLATRGSGDGCGQVASDGSLVWWLLDRSALRVPSVPHHVTFGDAWHCAGVLFPCHIAPWGFQSADQSRYNLFNGMYAATLFLNHFEYTHNKTFAKTFTYPLVDGFTRFWHCLLRPGTDGFLHDSATADSPFEGGTSVDPVTTLSLIKRMATFQTTLAGELGLTAPPYVAGIIEKLAPFATARNHDGQMVQVDSPTMDISKSQCSGSGECDPFFPVFPAELIDPLHLNTSAETRALEKATAFQYTGGMHSLGLAVFWPFVIRSTPRSEAKQVVHAFISDAAGKIGPNLIKYATGGGTENAGLALAVTDMLVRAPGGEYIVLFPGWPTDEPASFVNLLTKGGWRVTAAWDTEKNATGVTITNAAAGSGTRTCRLESPWAAADAHGGDVAVRCDGGAVVVSREGTLLSWPAPEGAACTVGAPTGEGGVG